MLQFSKKDNFLVIFKIYIIIIFKPSQKEILLNAIKSCGDLELLIKIICLIKDQNLILIEIIAMTKQIVPFKSRKKYISKWKQSLFLHIETIHLIAANDVFMILILILLSLYKVRAYPSCVSQTTSLTIVICHVIN